MDRAFDSNAGGRASAWSSPEDLDQVPRFGEFEVQDGKFPLLEDFGNLEVPANERLAEQFQQMYDPASDIDQAEKPFKTERVSFIEDKANGGKGYEKTQNVFKQLDVPGGKGFYKASSKQTGFSWSSDAKPTDE